MTRVVITVLFAAAMSAHAAEPADYAVVVPITTTGDSAAWRVEVPLAAHAWSQDETLRDVAVFDADGHAVPLDRWEVPAAAATGGQRADVVPLALPVVGAADASDDLRLLVERDTDGRLRLGTARTPATDAATRSWLVDAAAFDAGIDALELHWDAPADGVFARFAVDASDDLQRWRTLSADAPVVLLQQDAARIERRVIDLAGARAKTLRLRRLDDGATLQGLRVGLERRARSGSAIAPLQWLTLDAPTTASSPLDYALPARVSIDALRITLAGDNSAARIAVSMQTDAAAISAWRAFVDVDAYSLRNGDTRLDQGDLVVARTSRIARLRLEPTRPLTAPPRVAVGWRAPSFVFLAEGRGPWVLAAGHARERREASPLGVPLAALRARLGNDWQPPLASTGELREAAGASALAAAAPAHDWRRTLLWIVLGAGAVGVIAIALSLLRGQGRR